jgi:membrane-associated phospholipid phosphatase
VTRRPLALLAGALLVAFIALAAWARLTSVGKWDLELAASITTSAGPFLGIASLLDAGFALVPWSLAVALLAAFAWLRGRRDAAVLLILVIAADLVAAGVKLLVARGRPEAAFVEHLLGQESFAFPSGHVVRATALAAVVVWLVAPPAWRLPALVVAGIAAGLVMGWSRVALGVHWPSDVLGGLLLGLAWVCGSLLFVQQLGQRQRV